MHDLAVIIVSTNEAKWLPACLASIYDHRGDCTLDVVVADNQSTDGTAELVRVEFPQARVVGCVNRGFAHANNRGVMTTDARYVLFLNPDTEVREGTFGELVRILDARPDIGLAGVVQLTSEGEIYPTIRRFPNALRAFGQAVGVERLPFRSPLLGERELDLDRYAGEAQCDWTSGSFMLARREALESAGLMDERFFIYSEEPDLCLRVRRAGWQVWHLPQMTIVHHAGKGGLRPKMWAQDAYTRMQYARKHFSPLHRLAYGGALGLGYGLRAVAPERKRDREGRRRAAAAALRALVGIGEPPFGRPPRQAVAVRPESWSAEEVASPGPPTEAARSE
jgi:N-acetylglucosaminyl-diphospho-decaprenol L-rhamnosyltransferase